MDQQQLSKKQFDSHAAAYLSSAVHAKGADLERLRSLVAQIGPAHVLDLGCGAGHASYAAAAGGAGRVTAYDPSAQMLEVVAREAAARGHRALETCAGSAETLAFGDACFDMIVTRFSAHHWANVPRALAECRRVLKPARRVVVIDVVAPDQPGSDTALQTIEFLRDASHMRNYRVCEWASMLQAAGFAAPIADSWKLPLEFSTWVARIGTPAVRIAALQAVFADLSDEARSYLGVGSDGSFAIEAAWMQTGA
jgi:ubiquinone/menaquinone biosynthesis C-methylase UbiE